MMHPLLAAFVDEAEESFAKKAGRNRGLVSIGQRWQSRSKPGMIPGGTRAALGRVRRERDIELTAGLATRSTTGLIGGGALAALIPATAPYAPGGGFGLGLGDTLKRTSRLNRIAGYLDERAKGRRKTKPKRMIEREPG